MSTSVRLPTGVEEELASYCVDHKLTKSEVITTAVSEFLRAQEPAAVTRSSAGTSPVYNAFARAGLIGAVGAGEPKQDSMTNARVREFVRGKVQGKQRTA